jgi:hypothetical protein
LKNGVSIHALRLTRLANTESLGVYQLIVIDYGHGDPGYVRLFRRVLYHLVELVNSSLKLFGCDQGALRSRSGKKHKGKQRNKEVSSIERTQRA